MHQFQPSSGVIFIKDNEYIPLRLIVEWSLNVSAEYQLYVLLVVSLSCLNTSLNMTWSSPYHIQSFSCNWHYMIMRMFSYIATFPSIILLVWLPYACPYPPIPKLNLYQLLHLQSNCPSIWPLHQLKTSSSSIPSPSHTPRILIMATWSLLLTPYLFILYNPSLLHNNI